jgi:hypothetical protein
MPPDSPTIAPEDVKHLKVWADARTSLAIAYELSAAAGEPADQARAKAALEEYVLDSAAPGWFDRHQAALRANDVDGDHEPATLFGHEIRTVIDALAEAA